ncbi:MAG: tRNA 2-thiouridine(34) synthase MnmA [Myxococcota bacterium]
MKRLEGRRCRVVVAMSGGVDSSTTAGLLVEAGHEVIGVMMKLYDQSDATDPDASQQCCGLDDVSDARRVADGLGIPFYVGNYQEAFRKGVVDPFVDAYVQGRTPNPCVRCNDTVKFRTLLARARMLGADYLATGHYVRTTLEEDGSVALRRGRDPGKDQSYFVAGIPRKSLERVIFPLGDLTKGEVRGHAERMGLPVASKSESQEICFVPDDDYARYVEEEAGERLRGGGPIVSLDGMRLGRHRGLHRYTVGQRRGLGISAPEPRYVVRLRPDDNALVVGRKQDVRAGGVRAERPRWLVDPPAPGARVIARVRHRHDGAAARIEAVDEQRLSLAFEEPVTAVTPGQQLVLYDRDRVLGAATIEGPAPAREATMHG